MLPANFYKRNDVVLIARELLGKTLFSTVGGILTGGIIVETEAYRGPEDRASHAFNNLRTPRTEVMFQEGGIAYIYLCYGIHHLLNVVTADVGTPHAVLIRAIAPTHGIETMLQRRKKIQTGPTLTSGPGSVCEALGITRDHNGHSFNGPLLSIEESDLKHDPSQVSATSRIGVDYAGQDAALPWRFVLEIPSHSR
ncbi:MAG: DNA-3-methyladenine glycosylase [Rhabdochlamydiaceae bacterium]